MKFLPLVLVLTTAWLADANRAKRFAGFGLSSLSTVGGNLGCVVTGEKLFVNGLEGRDLTAEEKDELADYQQKLALFRDELKQAIAEQRAELEERRAGGQSVAPAEPRKKPQAPKKPSFCSEQATTQYIFDGCKVQNNVVYVGSTYARRLTDSEIDELKQFDKEMTAYQKTVTSSLEQQLSDIFSGALSGGRPQISRPAEKPASTPLTAPAEAPKSPNFCTLIV